VWLLATLAVGLALRLWWISEPLEQDEFGPLYAVGGRLAEKPGLLPSEANPLLLVPSWADVSARSVLPFGIRNPLPLYHWLLYAWLHAVPITEWSLRLPSLLAGLGCIVGVYLLCRRLLGEQVALVAALLAALDPMQTVVSSIARPYALGNLACLLSFWALLGILYGRSTASRTGSAVGYGVTMALQGYLNPVLLLVGVGHVGILVYWWLGRPRQKTGARANPSPWAFRNAPPRSVALLLFWLAGCVLAVVLLLPQMRYVQEVQAFTAGHRDYLSLIMRSSLTTVVIHNSTFLVALLVVCVAGAALRLNAPTGKAAPAGTARGSFRREEGAAREPVRADERTVAEAAPAPAENPDLVWLGRCWLFLPQLAVLLLARGLGQPVLLSRYFSYVGLGGVILLAYWTTRDRRKGVRLGVIAVAALAMSLMQLAPLWSLGWGLTTDIGNFRVYLNIRDLEYNQKWQECDVLLYQPGFLEADLLPDRVPEANRAQLEGVLAAPLTTLYVGKQEHPDVLLSYSNRRDDTDEFTRGGPEYHPERFSTKELAQQLATYSRYWFASSSSDSRSFLACLIPWLATAQDHTLKVARERDGAERSFQVKPRLKPGERVPGLRTNCGQQTLRPSSGWSRRATVTRRNGRRGEEIGASRRRGSRGGETLHSRTAT
jgi:hypothetical protein